MPHDHDGEVPRVRLAWGRRGAQAAAEQHDILVVIDTLRFSSAAATGVHHGALVNAKAVAGAVSYLLSAVGQRSATVLACGERWQVPDEEGVLRFALEDYIGAGAVLSALPFAQTMEAQACGATFQAMQDHLEAILWECDSGQELRAKGLGEDVRFAAQLNIYDTAPVLRGERLEIFLQPEEHLLS
jgi:phosphosulfolactate phosphohydrolase-like enzyme